MSRSALQRRHESPDWEEGDDDGPTIPMNPLSSWGNEKTMNINTLVLSNIVASPYFKVQLIEKKTFHEVVDEIYYRVDHLEPWEKGSRRTANTTGMCGGVRGVGAGGIVSSCFCLLYKLFTLKLTKKQLTALLNHVDSPYIRALGFMFIRFSQDPKDLWDWYEPYLDDDEELDVKAGGGHFMTIGEMLRQWLVKLEWYATLFPRIPVPIEKQIHAHLRERPIIRNGGGYDDGYEDNFRGNRNDRGSNSRGGREPEHIPDDQVSFGEAEKAARGRNRGLRSPPRNNSRRSPPRRSPPRNGSSRRTPPRRSPPRRHSPTRDDYSRELERAKDRQRRERERSEKPHKDKKSHRDRSRSRSKDRRRSRSAERKVKRSRSMSREKVLKFPIKKRSQSKERTGSRERVLKFPIKKRSRSRSKSRERVLKFPIKRSKDRSKSKEKERVLKFPIKHRSRSKDRRKSPSHGDGDRRRSRSRDRKEKKEKKHKHKDKDRRRD